MPSAVAPAATALRAGRLIAIATIDELLDKVDSKYTLVHLAARRAREINSYYHSLGEGLGQFTPPLIESSSNKPLSIALEEIAGEKIVVQRASDARRVAEELLGSEEGGADVVALDPAGAEADAEADPAAEAAAAADAEADPAAEAAAAADAEADAAALAAAEADAAAAAEGEAQPEAVEGAVEHQAGAEAVERDADTGALERHADTEPGPEVDSDTAEGDSDTAEGDTPAEDDH